MSPRPGFLVTQVCRWALALSALSLMGSAWAQDTRLAGQALHCAAVLEALAQTHAFDAEQAARLQRAVGTFTEVHLQALAESGAAARAQADQRRYQALAEEALQRWGH